jgi:hypothetical protein
VIPLPISASNVERRDDGRAALAGTIRPPARVCRALEVVRRIEDARLLVAGDPSEPSSGAGDRVEWRLGYLPQSEPTARSARAPWRSSRIARSSTRARR